VRPVRGNLALDHVTFPAVPRPGEHGGRRRRRGPDHAWTIAGQGAPPHTTKQLPPGLSLRVSCRVPDVGCGRIARA
jgi:hypothetical protein